MPAGGFELAGEAERLEVARALQLVGGDGLSHAVKLLEELAQRLHRLVGLHVRGREERPGAPPHVER